MRRIWGVGQNKVVVGVRGCAKDLRKAVFVRDPLGDRVKVARALWCWVSAVEDRQSLGTVEAPLRNVFSRPCGTGRFLLEFPGTEMPGYFHFVPTERGERTFAEGSTCGLGRRNEALGEEVFRGAGVSGGFLWLRHLDKTGSLAFVRAAEARVARGAERAEAFL